MPDFGNMLISFQMRMCSTKAIEFLWNQFPDIFTVWNHYLERASALDFKDAAAPQFAHRNVVFCIL